MGQSSEKKARDGGFLNNLKEAFLPEESKKYRAHHVNSYSVTGNGVAYRKASSYLKDKKVAKFLEEAEQVRVAR